MTLLQILAALGMVLLLTMVVKHIDWSHLCSSKKQQHLVFGATASLFILWIFRAGIYEGLYVHFLWLSALALLLGLRWSMLVATAALVAVTALGYERWEMLGVNGLLGVTVPLLLTHLFFSVSFHRLPRNLFVYIFVCAFFPGALVIATKMALLGGYYVLEGTYDWLTVKDNFIVLIPLMLFPEGMLNGMTMTLLIIYKPDWVYTFHDKFYIDGK
ncbi:energy-coupling factor ABC transporter permease [Alteromonas oceanisediminis]|uniref:energy-coupling factor ABC transporter permease n=1 Tax=Alteromonas oceanisediminis TaxID=2836180 RepID=UPI001BD9C996|nr:energy-coupling factor ABC transporter permease [Alteromonas oceanisediminis]MBT0587260.1 energy-coupling factor ABC transporter permease [Alteromonas oceanisediminis]